MKIINKIALFAVAMSIGGAIVGRAVLPPLATPAANVPENWPTNGNGWGIKDVYDPLTNAPSDCWSTNSISLSIAKGPGQYKQIKFLAGSTNASLSRFVGDYAGNQIESVSFDVKAQGLISNPGAPTPTLAFKVVKPGSPGVVWEYKTTVIPADTASNWVHVTVPMSFSTDWFSIDYFSDTFVTPPDAAPLFDFDKQFITELFIKVVSPPTTYVDQQVVVKGLTLNGPWNGPFTNGVSVAWLSQNGLDLDSAIGADSNRVILAYLANTNPNDPTDVFRVEIARLADGRQILKWKDKNKYAHYDLLEGTDLNDPSSFKGKAQYQNLAGSGTQTVAEVEGTLVTGPRFYKVQIRVQ